MVFHDVVRTVNFNEYSLTCYQSNLCKILQKRLLKIQVQISNLMRRFSANTIRVNGYLN